MSKTLRIAFVVEGPTDLIILEEVIAKFLEGRDFVPRYFQPEMSAVFQPVAGEHGLGWPGVCRWCRQVAKQAGGRARDNVFFDLNDLLVLQVDADIAGSSYAAGHIDDPFPGISTLPCEDRVRPRAQRRIVSGRWCYVGLVKEQFHQARCFASRPKHLRHGFW